ncbi:hypothetical protein BJ166DRAFT_105104 [Pestalotiopsis sp. NC0098]|nr:hypothetical protein BJ166DRAFT_105104 [Pestalotiopsis sp. NC0098]
MPRKRKTPITKAQENPTETETTNPTTLKDNTKHNKKPGMKTPVYFFRESDPKRGYLSQWYAGAPFRDPVDAAPKVYRTAEHYMMHHKALLFGDAAIAAEVLEANHPKDVKALGRAVRGFDEAVWIAERERIVQRASYCKFTHPVAGGMEGDEGSDRVWKLGDSTSAIVVAAPSFRKVLLDTGDRLLVEASPWDRIWGIGYRAETAEANRATWGENLLGKALMAAREEFKREDAVAAAGQ